MNAAILDAIDGFLESDEARTRMADDAELGRLARLVATCDDADLVANEVKCFVVGAPSRFASEAFMALTLACGIVPSK